VRLLEYLFAVIPMLGILIFVHELGHFLVAKACGVRVIKFSLGFGPPIGIGRFRLRWERAGTEYVIAWFPLGGFVKMLGEQLHGDEPEPHEIPDARPDEYLNAKRTWQKLAITFAGPVMNLLLPVVAFVIVLWVGIPKSLPVIGMVERGSPAARVGLAPGDRILEIDGVPVSWWDEVSTQERAAVGEALDLRLERDGEIIERTVPVDATSSLDEFGSVLEVGRIGIGNRRLPALLGVPAVGSPADLAGLRSGDLVESVDGEPVEDWEALRRIYESAAGPVRFGVRLVGTVAQEDKEEAPLETRTVPALGTLAALGVVPATALVQEVSPGRPADRAGLQSGDLIVAVDGEPVGSFASFAETVRSSEGRPLEITYARGGEITRVLVAPEQEKVAGPLDIEGMEESVYRIGISHAVATLPGAEQIDQVRNPMVAIPRAVEMTVDTTVLFLRGLGKLLTGEVKADKLAGPIGIAEIARKSLDIGWKAYLSTMILISINLGILNLLPIPVLDGGQALIYAIEGIQRSPLSLRTRERVQGLGLTMLLMLMGLAFWNDLSRHWSNFVEWLTGAGL